MQALGRERGGSGGMRRDSVSSSYYQWSFAHHRFEVFQFGAGGHSGRRTSSAHLMVVLGARQGGHGDAAAVCDALVCSVPRFLGGQRIGSRF